MTMGLMLPTFGEHMGLEFTQRSLAFMSMLLKSLGAPILGLAAVWHGLLELSSLFCVKGVDRYGPR